MSGPHVHLEIDRLVLRGFEPDQREAILAALTAELRQQLSDPDGLRSWGGNRTLAKLAPAAVASHPTTNSRQIGINAAREIVRGLRA